jgi:hypothetical protein
LDFTFARQVSVTSWQAVIFFHQIPISSTRPPSSLDVHSS